MTYLETRVRIYGYNRRKRRDVVILLVSVDQVLITVDLAAKLLSGLVFNRQMKPVGVQWIFLLWNFF
jgi:hypothetical protein